MQESSADERWLPIPGYEGAYEVSDRGHVRSVDRVVNRSGHAMQLPGKPLRPKPHNRGYEKVALSALGVVRDRYIHELVLTAFLSARPLGTEVCHENGDPRDNRLINLRWGTHVSNMNDVIRHGRSVQRNRSHCPRRHALVAPNLVPSTLRLNRRDCLACSRARAQVREAKRHGVVLDLQAVSDKYYEEIMLADTA